MTTLIELAERWEKHHAMYLSYNIASDYQDCAAELRALLTEARGQGIMAKLRNALNSHYWRDGKGCLCEFYAGDYNTWMDKHFLPILASVLLAYGIQVGQPGAEGG